MPQIFVSYGRADSRAITDRIDVHSIGMRQKTQRRRLIIAVALLLFMTVFLAAQGVIVGRETPTLIPTQNATAIALALLDAQATLSAQSTATQIARVSPTPATTGRFSRMTAGNLKPGYVLPGDCYSFSPDSQLIATSAGAVDVKTGVLKVSASNGWSVFSPDSRVFVTQSGLQSGVYDAATGIKRFKVSWRGYQAIFSPDSTLLFVSTDGLYDVATGVKRIDIRDKSAILGADFSPDGAFVAIGGQGVYDTKTFTLRFELPNSNPVFSSDGTLVAAGGIYEVATGKKRFSTTEQRFSKAVNDGQFSPDGKLLVVDGDGLYDVATGEKRFSINTLINTFSTHFTPDSQLLWVSGLGMLDPSSGAVRFPFTDSSVSFSPDGTQLGLSDGVYTVANGKKHFTTPALPIFSWNSKFVISASYVYDAATGTMGSYIVGDNTHFSPDGTLLEMSIPGSPSYCVLYGAADNVWPLHNGVITVPSGTAIRQQPNADATMLQSVEGNLMVNGRSADSQWYQVTSEGNTGWIASSAVSLAVIPDALPVITA